MIGQVLVDSLVNAALLAPPAVAFSMLFGILRFPNFAVGGYFTVGVYIAYAVNVPLGLPVWVAIVAAMVGTALLVWATDLSVFRPMRDSAPVTLLVVSISLAFVLEHVVRLVFGAEVKGLNVPLERPVLIGDVRVTPEQAKLVVAALVVVVVTHLVLRMTRIGKAMRAMADNPQLAQVRGIRAGRVRAFVTLYGGALLGLSGVVGGLNLVIEPMLGWSLIVPIIAAAILGGIGSIYGAMLGALLVGLAEELAFIALAGPYKIAVGFVLIAVLLLFRPHGLLGAPEIKK